MGIELYIRHVAAMSLRNRPGHDNLSRETPGVSFRGEGETLFRYIVSGAVLFFVAYVPCLLNDKYLIDDGVWFGQDLVGALAAKQQLFDLKRPFLWYMINAADWAQGCIGPYVHVARIYGFVVYLVAYLLSMYSLYLTRYFSVKECFWISSLSALAPLNFSRISEVNTLNYATAYLLFVLGVYAAIQRDRRVWIPGFALLSGVFLFLSYFTESFICLGAVLWLPFYLRYRSPLAGRFSWKKELRLLRAFLYANPHFWIPIFASFLFLKKTTGTYAHVNQVTVFSALLSPLPLLGATIRSFFSLFNFDIFLSYPYVVLACAFMSATVLFLSLKNSAFGSDRVLPGNPSLDNLSPALVFSASLSVLLLSVFPYVLVGKAPIPRQLEDRHQLTFSLVIGPVLFFLIQCVVKKNMQQFILSLLVVFLHQ